MTNLNSKTLKLMFQLGAKEVADNYEYIDELNVFPVPDGDTGTNLKITTTGAFDTIASYDDKDMALLAKTFARGLLMNARGNSGVIFSQIFKGFSTAFAVGKDEATIVDVINGFVKAKEFAYHAVATPIEGTILTVIRVVAEKLLEASGKFQTMEQLFEFATKEAKIILDKTPDFLMQLKEVGVVDSGGYGLVCFLNGMYDALVHPEKLDQEVKKDEAKQTAINKNFVDNNDGFGYCSEFIMKLGSKVTADQKDKDEFDEKDFKKRINAMGDCFVYVRDEDIVKVHVHVVEPYKLLEYASKFGEFTKIKIENMTLQFLAKHKGTSLEKAQKEFNQASQVSEAVKVVATVPSNEIKDVYAEQFGITNVINCSQIGNPSIQQFYDLIKSAKSTKVIVVTDNGNVIMAAEQAAKLFPRKKYDITIIPSKDIATSYLTCLAFNPEMDFDDNVKEMWKVLKTTEAGKVSVAVKNIKFKNVAVKIGDYIGVVDKEIIISNKTPFVVNKKVIDELIGKFKRVTTAVVIYGKDATLEEVNAINKYLVERYLVKPIIIQGCQSTYHYYIGVTK